MTSHLQYILHSTGAVPRSTKNTTVYTVWRCLGWMLCVSQLLDTMQYLQQPAGHRHHAQPAHQPTQSLHHGTSAAPFVNGSGGGTLLGQHLRTVAHRNNAAAAAVAAATGTFTAGATAHATNDAFHPSLCKHF